EEERVVDHDEPRLVEIALHPRNEALLEVGAPLADARLARRGDLAPDRIALAERDQLRDVARLGVPGPRLDEREAAADGGLGERADALPELVVAPQAEVVAEALAERGLRVDPEVLGDEGQVLVDDLLLERLGRGGDDDLSPA